jgi:hypothetical protein
MALEVLWQHDCPGYIETEVIDGVIQVTCFVEEMPPSVDRVTDGLQALYTFEDGTGATVRDVSGTGKPLDLVVESEAAVEWMPGGGLLVNSATVIASAGPASKLITAVQSSNQITIEAWVRPADVTQDGPARIVTLSTDYHNRNFQLGQAADLYDLRLRTTETTNNGQPSLSTPPGAVTAELTHVVYTRNASGVANFYIDKESVAGKIVGGDLSNWNTEYRLAVANELLGSRAWLGEFHLVAIYGRALTAQEVNQNFEAGTHGS